MIITLTTDFGLSDPFVGIMKGVILAIAPDAQLVDITHEIHSYDVLEAAFLIQSAYRYFPEKTVHVVVVDPGVGSTRRPIAASLNGQFFVAPDNGVLSPIVQDAADTAEVYQITNRSWFLNSVSQTFHGRDIFAPVAARLAAGASIDSAGPRIFDPVEQSLPEPRSHDGKIAGVALRVDRFGNIITNLRMQHLGSGFRIRVSGTPITRLCTNFAEGKPGEVFAIEGSTGYIELAVNQGSAAERLNIGPAAEIEVESGLTNH